jgi:tetratricopeptide (TPR) repeat protein
MSKLTDKSRFMVPSMSLARFYQEVFTGAADYRKLGNRLIRKAEAAHAFRQFDIVKEVGQILFNFPIKEYSSIGLYFIGVAFNSCGNGDQDKAKSIFERVADSAPDRYRAKAILSLAAVSFNTRDYDSALYFYNETLKAAPLGSASIQAIRTIAMLKGMAGDHHRAAKDLENLCSLIKYAPPHVYFDCLNSLAVELGEIGRKNEARNIIRHVLASPYAFAYPEWQSTADELRGANRSFVVIRPTRIRKGKLLFMPPREIGEPIWSDTAAPIVSLDERRQKMVKDNDKPNLEDMTESEIMMEIIHTLSAHDVTYEQRLKVLESIRKIMTEPPKDEDED